MKRIFFVLLFVLFVFSQSAIAERDTATTTTYNSSQLLKTGEGLIYSVSFVATSSNGNYMLRDAITDVPGFSNVKSEGSEATSLNSQFQDYSNKPLEFTTGLYLVVTNGYVTVSYK